jgi:hypothetical protein
MSNTAPLVSRFAFPYPCDNTAQLRKSILWLMLDCQRRSLGEIRRELGTEREIGARIRELRTPEFGGWPFNDSRSEGKDEDGVFRYQLNLDLMSDAQRARVAAKRKGAA